MQFIYIYVNFTYIWVCSKKGFKLIRQIVLELSAYLQEFFNLV